MTDLFKNIKDLLPLLNTVGIIAILVHYINKLRDIYNQSSKLQNEHIKFLEKQTPSFMYNQIESVKKSAEEHIQNIELSTKSKISELENIISNQEKHINTRINNIAHEIQIYTQGALSVTDRLQFELSEDQFNNDAMHKINALSGMMIHIGNITSNLLWVSSNTHLLYSKVDLVKLIENTVDMYKWYADRREMEIILDVKDCHSAVECSELHIQQVVSNLIHNAIKYSNKGKFNNYIKMVSVSLFSENKSLFCAKFSNYGPGILEDEVVNLFDGLGISRDKIVNINEMYRKGYSSNDLLRVGSGLGLIIVKDIIESHGGNIEVSSEPSENNSFLNSITFKIPSMKQE